MSYFRAKCAEYFIYCAKEKTQNHRIKQPFTLVETFFDGKFRQAHLRNLAKNPLWTFLSSVYMTPFIVPDISSSPFPPKDSRREDFSPPYGELTEVCQRNDGVVVKACNVLYPADGHFLSAFYNQIVGSF